MIEKGGWLGVKVYDDVEGVFDEKKNKKKEDWIGGV